MDEVLQEFISESLENLDQVDRHLIELEKTPQSPQLLAAIFRSVHTIKGASGFLGLSRLESLTHSGEHLLCKLRDGKLIINPEITSALLSLVDAIRRLIIHLQETGGEINEDFTPLIQILDRLQTPSASGSLPVEKIPAPVPAANPQPPVAHAHAVPAPAAAAIPAPAVSTPDAPVAPVTPPAPAPVAPAPAVPVATGVVPERVMDNKVRVDVSLLDKLMNLVGELVLARNQIMQLHDGTRESRVATALQRLDLVTTELQEEVMKTRLQPIETVWAKFPRIVRDLGLELGKQVRLEMDGKEKELDRTIIEAIKDPLTHIVRNSIDHGIEKPDKRRASGKQDEGLLLLRAYHEGGQVNIEIMDDGAGIDVNRVKQKAVERGLVAPDAAARMSDREAFHLLFLPGFSTAERVTNVSGRGVGMDVVKTNIEKIGGSVDISSAIGKGTTIKLKIPLTLAIIPALLVTSAGERFAIPQVSLLELVRLEPEQARTAIETIYGLPVYRLRGHLLALAFLDEELGLRGKEGVMQLDRAVNIVVLQADGRQFGLVVDEINDTEEIVVKPLGKQLKGISCYAGATIMGDGKLALILDVLGLAQLAGTISEVREKAMNSDVREKGNSQAEMQQLLVFNVGRQGRMAIPLSMVARLEEIPRSKVEHAGNREVVQYRGQIMPLIDVSRQFNHSDSDTSRDLMQVIVYSEQGRSVGLVVGSIQDIVKQEIGSQAGAKDGHSLVIQDRVTDLLDVPDLLRRANVLNA